jgi:hypothetical protein
MADQYRIAGEFGWMSNSGNALLAITNPVGSNKKLVIKSLEVTSLSSCSAVAPSAAEPTLLKLARATVAGGIPVPMQAVDSLASDWPATVRVTTRAAVSGATDIGRIAVSKRLNQSIQSWYARQRVTGRLSGLVIRRRGGYGATDAITVRDAESVTLYAPSLVGSTPLRVRATMVLSGSPDRAYETTFITHVIGQGVALLSVENEVASGHVVSIISIAIEEIGTFDSPYFQLVPAGSIEPDAVAAETGAVTIMRMDTASPDPSSSVRVFVDVPILPFGMPENALAEGSTGSPKGYNYLKTKDFLGPVFRTLFPEYIGTRSAGTPDGLGHVHGSHRAADMGMRSSHGRGGADITIREGEIVALVSAAETAAGATAAVGMSGWASFHFAVNISVEPKATPTLSLTGLRNPTEIRVYDAGTTTEIAGQEDVTLGTFSWVYDPDAYPSVDISILSLGYQNLRLRGIALGFTDVTIPVQQQLDRQYANP